MNRDHPQILVKKTVKKETSEVLLLLTVDLWSNRQMRSYIGITANFISNETLQNAMLRLQTIERPSHS